jgi:hypothetical protein
LTCATKIIGHAAVANPSDTLGILISPVFNYKAGTLYMDEFGVLKTLHSDGCTVDNCFSLIFDVKTKAVAWASKVRHFFLGLKRILPP